MRGLIHLPALAARIVGRLVSRDVGFIAGGLAFFALLAVFPTLAGILFVYGLVADPVAVENQLAALARVLPEAPREILTRRLVGLTEASPGTLSLQAAGALLIVLWSSMRGVKALIQALNLIYGVPERRGFIHLNLLSMAMTAGMILFVTAALALLIALPGVTRALGLELTGGNFALARWGLMLALAFFGLAWMYRYGPSARRPRWRIAWAGAVAATALWAVMSGLFALYVRHAAGLTLLYGSIGAVVLLMLWFYGSAWCLLLGAAINRETAQWQSRLIKDLSPPERGPRPAS